MSLTNIKALYVEKKVQIIEVDTNGVIKSTDNTLFPFNISEKLEEQHPFFYTLTPLLGTKTNESYPCININVGKIKKIVDINILNQDDSLYIVLTDFTDHYERSQPLVQEKNESIIAENKLLFEKELLFAKEEFKNNFLANLNHEIRNPLNALLGFSELLGETSLTFQQKETLGVLQKTGVHIKVLMDNLLDISKIETGKIQVREVPFNLHSVIASMSKHFQLKKDHTKIELTYDTAANVPSKLYGDPTRINQILYNLLENAYRNTKEGTITLKTSLDKPTVDNVATIKFTISDTGHGISNKNLDTIFDSYIQLQIEKEKPLGEGLGLKIVKELTSALSGTVSVKSEHKKGSVFTVILPIKTRDKTKKRKTVAKGSGIVMHKRILAVEDETLNQMLLMKQFIDNDKGYSLQIAPNDEVAIKMLESKKHLGIIIKQSYESFTGIDFIKKLKSSETLKEIPVLVVSGKAMIDEQEEILAAGASAFLRRTVW